MQKTYQRINWQNYPNEETPLSASNLNRLDYATNEIDDRVIALDTAKANATDLSNMVVSVSVDDVTGVITLTKYNGTTTTIQTTLNKIAVNFAYDYNTQNLILTLNDGSTARIDISTLIQNNEFADTDTISLEVSTAGIVMAKIVNGSITEAHLRRDFLADIRVAEENAAQSESDAEAHMLDSEAWAVGQRDGIDVERGDQAYHNNSLWYSLQAKSWAVGSTGNRSDEDTDNSKFYSQVAQSLKDDMISIRDDAQSTLEQANARLTGLNFMLNFVDGCLYYDVNTGINMQIDSTTGELMWEVIS